MARPKALLAKKLIDTLRPELAQPVADAVGIHGSGNMDDDPVVKDYINRLLGGKDGHYKKFESKEELFPLEVEWEEKLKKAGVTRGELAEAGFLKGFDAIHKPNNSEPLQLNMAAITKANSQYIHMMPRN